MNLIYLLFLFLSALVFTWLFTMVIGNQGPWNNPMFFFLVLFMTSWALVLWMDQGMPGSDQMDYLYGAGVLALVALLLAAAEKPDTRIRKFQWALKRDGRPVQSKPNSFFWILLAMESCMIIASYIITFKQNQGN